MSSSTAVAVAVAVAACLAVSVAVAAALTLRGRRHPLPAGRLRRTLAPLRLQASTAARWCAAHLRGLGHSADRREELKASFHTRTAQDAAELMGDMKGAFMKIGQILSFVTAGLPEAYQDAFESLQAEAPPIPPHLVRETVAAELGAPPAELFAHFRIDPMAAASIGQVHEARTLDGRDVVVKVQYPGVDRAIAADLSNAGVLYRLVGAGMPGLDAAAVVDELRSRITEELDYEAEARSLATFADLYRDHPDVRVPSPVPELSTRRVLTMTRLDGLRWAEALSAPPEMRDQWGEVVFRFVFASLYRHGVFNADPHPGNFLFRSDGSVGFLDYGCTRRFTPDELAGMRALGRAVQAGDPAALAARLVSEGFITTASAAEVGHERLLAYWRLVYEPAVLEGERRIPRDWADAVAAATLDTRGEWSDVTRRLNLPAAYVMATRINIGVYSLLAQLGATADWRSILEDCWDPSASALGDV